MKKFKFALIITALLCFAVLPFISKGADGNVYYNGFTEPMQSEDEPKTTVYQKTDTAFYNFNADTFILSDSALAILNDTAVQDTLSHILMDRILSNAIELSEQNVSHERRTYLILSLITAFILLSFYNSHKKRKKNG